MTARDMTTWQRRAFAGAKRVSSGGAWSQDRALDQDLARWQDLPWSGDQLCITCTEQLISQASMLGKLKRYRHFHLHQFVIVSFVFLGTRRG